jgi:hypothetical protein
VEPISSMVAGLLAAGAAAVGKQVGGLAVKDAYEALKKLAVDFFGRPSAIAAVEEDPSSDALKAALREVLAKAEASKEPGAAGGAEIIEKAKALGRALEGVPQRDLSTVGLLLDNVRTANVELDRIDVTGPGAGAVVRNSTLEGDFRAGPISVKGKGTDPN